MNTERLTHLITVLQGVIEQGRVLDMATWADTRTTTGPRGGVHVCGSTACAMGYAALDPLFQAAGLSLRVTIMTKHPHKQTLHHPGDADAFNALVLRRGILIRDAKPMLRMPDGEDHFGFTAACEFFDLDDGQADWLFLREAYDAQYPTAADVIERIQSLIGARHDA